jgi:hypothetical protein
MGTRVHASSDGTAPNTSLQLATNNILTVGEHARSTEQITGFRERTTDRYSDFGAHRSSENVTTVVSRRRYVVDFAIGFGTIGSIGPGVHGVGASRDAQIMDELHPTCTNQYHELGLNFSRRKVLGKG